MSRTNKFAYNLCLCEEHNGEEQAFDSSLRPETDESKTVVALD